jgi:hypothetical protein
MTCPNCQHNGSQKYMGERFNPTSLSVEGLFRCETCHCEYTEKGSGRVVVTRKGMTRREVLEARHALVVFPLSFPINSQLNH